MRRTERQPVTFDNSRQLVAQFYKAYFKGIYRFIFRLSGDADDTRDITQEVFIKLFDYLNRNGEISTPKAWLYRVAVNTCHSHLRRQAKFQQIVARELEDGNPAGVNGQASDVLVNMRFYEGIRAKDLDKPTVVTSFYVEPFWVGNIVSETDLSQEKSKLKRIFNVEDVKLLTRAPKRSSGCLFSTAGSSVYS